MYDFYFTFQLSETLLLQARRTALVRKGGQETLNNNGKFAMSLHWPLAKIKDVLTWKLVRTAKKRQNVRKEGQKMISKIIFKSKPDSGFL